MTPFHPRHDPDADRLNDLLDGASTPNAGAEAGDLAAIARELRLLADRAKGSTNPETDGTFDAIWEELMSAHAHAEPPTIIAVPGRSPATVPPRTGAMPVLGRLHGFLSAALVALMLAGMVGAAWTLRGTTGPGDPRGNGHLAAITSSPEASAEASPESDAFWTAYLDPRECTTPGERFTNPELSELRNDDRTWPERTYLPIEDAPDDDATAAAIVAREWQACISVGSPGPVTERWQWESISAFAPTWEEQAAHRRTTGQQISAQYPIQDPAAFAILSEQKPDFGLGRSLSTTFIVTPTYVPDQAIALVDGRIGIPSAFVFWMDDPNLPLNPDGKTVTGVRFITTLVILANVDDAWKVDEIVDLCAGDCDAYWSGALESTPVATPEISLPLPTAQAATPVASPETNAFWMDYVIAGPRFCTATTKTPSEREAMLARDHEWSERGYAPISDAPEDDAIAAAMVAREWEACEMQAPATDRFLVDLWSVWGSPNGESFEERTARDEANARAISEQYPIQDPAAFVFLTDEKPEYGIGTSAATRYYMTPTYVPEQAVTLADGRIAIPMALLIWKDDPNAPLNADGTVALHGFFSSQLVILANEDGQWKVDEMISFCVGNCADRWGTGLLEPSIIEATPPPYGEVLPSGTPDLTVTPYPTPRD